MEHQGLESALVRRTEENRKLKAELSRVKHSRTFRLQRKLNSMRKKLRSFFSSFSRPSAPPVFSGGVSIVIPTCRENDSLREAVDSVLTQTAADTEILIAVSGENRGWYGALSERYHGQEKVRVLYTERPGISAGRNLGIREARLEGLLFLDEDSVLTPGYLDALLQGFSEETEFVQGRLTEDPTHAELSGIDRAVKKKSAQKIKKDPNYISVFSTVSAKLFHTGTLQKRYEPFDEEAGALEDVIFWIRNFRNIRGKMAFQNFARQEACIRKTPADSALQPDSEQRTQALFSSFLLAAAAAEEIIFDAEVSYPAKLCASQLMNTQNRALSQTYASLPSEYRATADTLLQKTDSAFVNQGLFAAQTGIAFCHNFSPTIDPSAMVAPKRLSQIEQMEGGPIRWTVISKDMSNMRETDTQFDTFYSRFHYQDHTIIRGPGSVREDRQFDFGRIAFQHARGIPASVIYSRSMFPGSHVAAYLYKRCHEDVKWYAEFSDPLLYNPQDRKRELVIGETDDPFLRNFWGNVEEMVYEKADVILFTNENQKDYMLSYAETAVPRESIEQRSLVKVHPVIDSRYCRIVRTKYVLPQGINIAYFGSLPVFRDRSMLLHLLENPKVHLHLFTVMTSDLSGLEHERIHINKSVNYLEFLNLASQMDYLFVMDSENVSAINPWLPSKVSDYIASGTRIIAVVKEGSVLSKMTDPQFIIRYSIDQAFVDAL